MQFHLENIVYSAFPAWILQRFRMAKQTYKYINSHAMYLVVDNFTSYCTWSV